jgi:hypothetical protein
LRRLNFTRFATNRVGGTLAGPAACSWNNARAPGIEDSPVHIIVGDGGEFLRQKESDEGDPEPEPHRESTASLPEGRQLADTAHTAAATFLLEGRERTGTFP